MSERIEEVEIEGPGALDQASEAVSLALGRAGKGGKGFDEDARALLKKQSRLIDLQAEHLHEQRELQLAHLKVRRWKDRMSMAMQALGLAAGAAVVITIAVLAWSAHEDHGLLVEGFSAPPAFAQRGAGGEVVAADVMDKLSAIAQVARNHSFSSTGGVSADTSDQVKIEIPETGLSLAQAWRLLRDWLGSERKVTGSLRETGDGRIALTARLSGGQAFTVAGAPAELDRLEQQIAERIYGAVDPVNIVIYLTEQGRMDEAFAAAARNAANASGREDRADSLALWGDISSDPGRELRFGRLSLQVDPGLLAGHYNLAEADLILGRPEAALAQARTMPTLKDADQPRQHRGAGAAQMRGFARMTIDLLTGDFGSASLDRAAYDAGDAEAEPRLVGEATDAGRRHDPGRAQRLLAQAFVSGAPEPTRVLRARYAADAGVGDWAAAAAEARALTEADQRTLNADRSEDDRTGHRVDLERRDGPMLAEAEARTGDPAGAAATIGTTPLDCYDCLRVRGVVEALAGRPDEADRWFARAVRLAPSPPFAWTDWGAARLARGDPEGALARLGTAQAKGPRFADARELMGEALMARRDWAGAAGRFAEADKDAPAWGRNHLVWGQALMLAGRYAEARAQYEAADGLALSKADRAALNVLLARNAKGPLHG